MNNIRKRIIAICIVACMALSAVACSDKDTVGKGNKASSTSSSEDNSSSTESASINNPVIDDTTIEHIENEEGAPIITPFQCGSASALGMTDPNAPKDIDSPTTTAKNSSSGSNSAATQVVTAVVTDAAGAEVTDAAGEKVVETSIVTAAPEAPVPAEDGGDYKSATDSMYCLWIDISKDENYVFNDQTIKITFKIKDNIPNKDYAVRFNPDFSNIEGSTVRPKVVQGTIRVGSGDIEATDVSAEDGFVVYGDNIACNQGDTIDYYINLKDNPGLAAVLVWFYYDKNAMEVVEVDAAGEFADIAAKTQVGQKDVNED